MIHLIPNKRGMSLNNEDINNIVITVDYFNHRICTPSWSIEYSNTNFVDMTYVINGHAEYVINGKKYLVSPGDLLTIPKGSYRSAQSCPEALMECYCINGAIRNINGEDISMPFPIIYNIGLQKDIIDLYNEIKFAWQIRTPGYLLKVRSIYMLIIYHYFNIINNHNEASQLDKRIHKILQYVSNHFNEALTVKKMADMVDLSDMYLGWLFKKETGMTFHNFLTSIRMNRAKELLSSGEYKVNEVAYLCGFSDVFYFSRVFKKHYGFAPSSL